MIAIVAVAMIGVMVPSSFAEETSTFYEDRFGFSITYPEEWNSQETKIRSEIGALGFLQLTDNTGGILTIYYDDSPHAKALIENDLEEFAIIIMEEAKQMCEIEFKEDFLSQSETCELNLISTKLVTIDGYDGLNLKYSISVENINSPSKNKYILVSLYLLSTSDRDTWTFEYVPKMSASGIDFIQDNSLQIDDVVQTITFEQFRQDNDGRYHSDYGFSFVTPKGWPVIEGKEVVNSITNPGYSFQPVIGYYLPTTNSLHLSPTISVIVMDAGDQYAKHLGIEDPELKNKTLKELFESENFSEQSIIDAFLVGAEKMGFTGEILSSNVENYGNEIHVTLEVDTKMELGFENPIAVKQKYHYRLYDDASGVYFGYMAELIDYRKYMKTFDELIDSVDFDKHEENYESPILPLELSSEEPDIVKPVSNSAFDDSVCGSGTIMKNGKCVVEESEGGGCLIATATYGSEMAAEVQQLRELRDNQLLQTESGTQFMTMFNDVYYSFSPIIADYERENPLFKEAVKLAITPMISSLSLMENAESESEVLGIGISVIMLNLGMYLGVPAIVVIGVRKIR